MKTATITWITYENFGTFLQAYALQKEITSLGYENCIISDKKVIEFHHPRPCPKSSIRGMVYRKIKSLVGKGENKRIKDLEKIHAAYERFKEEYLNVDVKWRDFAELDNTYDVFVVGSDQIWAPTLPWPYFFGAFTNKPKIAYAPSVGLRDYPPQVAAYVKPFIERFDKLSVRERQGKEVLESFVDQQVQVVVDPTLLLSQEEWNDLLPKSEKGGDFVLCYLLTYNETYLDYVSRFARKKHLPMKIFMANNDLRLLNYGDECLFVGPLEFLQNIKHCSYFFTDSFHGTVFSIIMEKQFYTLKRFSEQDEINQNSRIENLFEMANLEDSFYDENSLDEINENKKYDFVQIKKNLQPYIDASHKYLASSLKELE